MPSKVFRVDDDNTAKENHSHEAPTDGIWIGIDLGTSTTTVAVWDIRKQRSKLLRFPPALAQPIERNGKLGRCIASAVLFTDDSREEIEDKSLHSNIFVGYDAIKHVEGKNFNDVNGSLITSAKRIWGMTYSQIQDELQKDPELLKTLPFECQLVDNGQSMEGLKIRVSQQTWGESESDHIKTQINEWIDPLDIARLILSSVRIAAQEYIYKQRRNLNALGAPISDDKDLFVINNCVLATPAHYSRNQRRLIIDAAKRAGFQRVETIIESTAAALSYGLFVSPKLSPPSDEIQSDGIAKTPTVEAKTIIVFDMGAGTTDVTIIEMNIDPQDDDAKFRVIATTGDKHLGGDDMDAALAQFVLQKIGLGKGSFTTQEYLFDYKDYAALRRLCRKAKEDLCGNDTWKDMREPKQMVVVSWKGENIEINQNDFCEIIQPLVVRVNKVFDNAFTSINSKSSPVVDELVVVGGASKTPSIRDMLRSRFPPPHPPELCCSIKGEAAVAQGAAIQTLIVSNLVPKYELRNAMMLDALPHTIGVLMNPLNIIGGEYSDEGYVPILQKNSPLPSKGSSRFTLATVRQKGVSVTIVEDVGDDYPLQRIGECHFLLHRLSENEIKAKCTHGIREVDIEILANKDGSLKISYFDENDPEHIRRRKLSSEPTKGTAPRSVEEILLIVGCIIFFLLYLGTKLIFNKIEVDL